MNLKQRLKGIKDTAVSKVKNPLNYLIFALILSGCEQPKTTGENNLYLDNSSYSTNITRNDTDLAKHFNINIEALHPYGAIIIGDNYSTIYSSEDLKWHLGNGYFIKSTEPFFGSEDLKEYHLKKTGKSKVEKLRDEIRKQLSDSLKKEGKKINLKEFNKRLDSLVWNSRGSKTK